MEDTSLEAKQRYMREKILDAGYDAEKFVQFCSVRHDLDDLENWSMDQLTEIVQDFIKSVRPSIQVHQLPIVDDTKQEFGNFQQPSVTPPSIPIPVASNKMGLVFSDDDWNMLLSGPSIINKATNNDNLNNNVQIPLFSLPLEAGHNQPIAAENSPKDIPLSPPSAVNPNKPSQPTIFIPPEQKKQSPKIESKTQLPPPSPVPQQKAQKKTNNNNNPINLSNIKIGTAKQKTFPPLPPINDVVVTKTEQVARNFLQSDYTLYHIQFTPSQHIIQRKFTDLRRARIVLQRLYPFLRLPYLEPEGWINSSQGKDPENLSKYKLMVEEFIKYLIIKSDQLKNCELVRTLCGFSTKNDKNQVSKDELKKKLQTYEYVSRPKFIGDVNLSNNNILIPPVSNGQKLINHTLSLLTEIDLHYDRLRKQLDQLIKSFSEVAFTFESLENLMKKYNSDNNELSQVRIFEGLKEMTIKLSNRIDGEYGIFKTRIKGLFRYQKQNMATLKEVIECRNKVNYEYFRRGQPAFTSNKLKLQGQNVEIQSPIPLEQPVRNNKNGLAIQQIFWSFMSSREINRYWQHLRRKIGEHLTLIAYDELDSENDNLNFWNLIIKKCVI